MVIVKLTGTFYYGPRGAKCPYGPGDAVEVPEGLALALGLTPIVQPAPVDDSLPSGASTATVTDPLAPFEALLEAGYTVETARAASDKELLAVKGIGPATLAQIRAALA